MWSVITPMRFLPLRLPSPLCRSLCSSLRPFVHSRLAEFEFARTQQPASAGRSRHQQPPDRLLPYLTSPHLLSSARVGLSAAARHAASCPLSEGAHLQQTADSQQPSTITPFQQLPTLAQFLAASTTSSGESASAAQQQPQPATTPHHTQQSPTE
jgi:hypothetical protein